MSMEARRKDRLLGALVGKTKQAAGMQDALFQSMASQQPSPEDLQRIEQLMAAQGMPPQNPQAGIDHLKHQGTQAKVNHVSQFDSRAYAAGTGAGGAVGKALDFTRRHKGKLMAGAGAGLGLWWLKNQLAPADPYAEQMAQMQAQQQAQLQQPGF
jgi:hypothetical protein